MTPKLASLPPLKESMAKPSRPKKGIDGKATQALVGLVHRVSEDLSLSADPEVLPMLGALRARQWEKAVDVADGLLSQQYEEKGTYCARSQLANMLRKIPLGDQRGPKERAMVAFKAAEHRCRRTNQRIRACRVTNRWIHGNVLQTAKDWIFRLLGESPDYDEIYSLCGFGPGVAVGVKGDNTHFQRKLMSEEISVTPTCAPYFRAAVWAHAQYKASVLDRDGQFSFGWYGARLEYRCTRVMYNRRIERRIAYVEANQIAFVPKTAKIHRTIAVEPLGNSFLQKGADLCLRRRLMNVGIDLSDQTLNQRLARAGSLGGFNPYVTLDLSAASDSVSIELVKQLLPPDWFTFLNNIRSPAYTLPDGTTQRYHKFVSMGNGFCFPLESLIFAALARSCGAVTGDRRDFSVYGDDIIVRQGTALYLTEVLRWCGFRINTAKSFYFGPFRESCGADFWDGENVRPYILDFVPLNKQDWIKIANGLRTSSSFQALTSAWEYCVNQVPRHSRLLRPEDGPPDGAITVPLDVFMSSDSGRWRRDLYRWDWQEFLPLPVDEISVQCNAARVFGLLYGAASRDDGTVQTPLRRRTRTIRRWILPDAIKPRKG